jgi:hypothetical protein
MNVRVSARSLVVCSVVVSGVFGLSGCLPEYVDPCSTAMPAPTAEQLDKAQRGLEVDESIEVNGTEVECVLVQQRGGGSFVWVSEPSD